MHGEMRREGERKEERKGEGGREERRKGGKEEGRREEGRREERRKRGREGGTEEERKGEKKGGREGGREEGREEGRKGGRSCHSCVCVLVCAFWNVVHQNNVTQNANIGHKIPIKSHKSRCI